MLPATAPIGVRTGKMSTGGQALLPLDGTLSKYTNVMKGWQNRTPMDALEEYALPILGYLQKYTNAMLGWRDRYFLLNPQQGVLEYHVSQAEAFGSGHRPRGTLHLAGAVISPSTEDSYTFSVNAANSEVYKLRATDAKERQHWVSHLRVVANHFTQQIAQEHPPIAGQSLRKPRSISASMSTIGSKIKDAADQVQQKTASTIAKHKSVPHGPTTRSELTATPQEKSPEAKRSGSGRPRTNSRNAHGYHSPSTVRRDDCKELREVKETLVSADNYHAGLMNMFDGLPHVQPIESDAGHQESSVDFGEVASLSALDEEVLNLKATSASALKCLYECYGILQHQQGKHMPGLPPGAQVTWVPRRDLPAPSAGRDAHSIGSKSLSNYSNDSREEPPQEPLIDPSDEICDASQAVESDLGTVEKHKSMIMHLLSQLKLGMDLTRVTLPTFILEKRSLLEMYADFLGHAELFLSIPGGPTPRERMIRVVRYYLTSFHCGRKGQLAKKPYNPILGETFQCSYYVPKTTHLDKDFEQNGRSQDQIPPSTPNQSTHYRIRYTSEQVSHHPPVSAFYADCPEREICMNTHIWTRSKFMNMSIGVVNIGEGVITLTGHKERYVVTFPSAFARSILTTPWMELGGRCTITCDQTNMAANVAFHTKPMYGGQPHKVTAEVKDVGQGAVFCRAEGEWNGTLTLTSTTSDGNQDIEVIDTSSYKGFTKFVRPLDKQLQMESRNLWKGVTAALNENDITLATDRKSALEDSQRKKEKRRIDSKQSVKTIMFRKDGDSYVFKDSLAGL